LLEIVPASGQSMLGSRYPAYYSSDLRKLASMLTSLDALITLDAGVMHLACASPVPTLSIFTVTSTAEWGPYGKHDIIVQALDRPPARVAEDVLAACMARTSSA
jgi:ADP-heptose:LPS heptosyltransferase